MQTIWLLGRKEERPCFDPASEDINDQTLLLWAEAIERGLVLETEPCGEPSKRLKEVIYKNLDGVFPPTAPLDLLYIFTSMN